MRSANRALLRSNSGRTSKNTQSAEVERQLHTAKWAVFTLIRSQQHIDTSISLHSHTAFPGQMQMNPCKWCLFSYLVIVQWWQRWWQTCHAAGLVFTETTAVAHVTDSKQPELTRKSFISCLKNVHLPLILYFRMCFGERKMEDLYEFYNTSLNKSKTLLINKKFPFLRLIFLQILNQIR